MILWGHNNKTGYYFLDSFISNYPTLKYKFHYDSDETS